MKKLLISLVCCLLPCLAYAALGIDGTPVQSTTATGTTMVLPGLTTTLTNDVIVIFYAEDGVSDASTTVTSAHLTFTKRGVAPGSVMSEWSAVASSALTSEVITVTFSGSTAYNAGCAFAISGANTSTIWDSHSGLPVAGNTAADPPISTTNANDIIIGGLGIGVTTPTSGSGWTTLCNGTSGQYFIAQYKIESSAQSGTTVAIGTGTGQENRYVVDAVIQASCTHNGWSSAGALATPNGSTGSYWSLAGNWVTPNCASINYFQQSGVVGPT